MILVDVNILIYASNDHKTDQHAAALQWLDQQLAGSAPVGLPWVTLLGFLRSSEFESDAAPVANGRRLAAGVGMAACDRRGFRQPTERHADVLAELLALPGMQGNLITDAHLAALAIEHGLTLCSTDGDFARFPRLQWRNPLAA